MVADHAQGEAGQDRRKDGPPWALGVAALGEQRIGPRQYLEGGLGAEPGHPRGELHGGHASIPDGLSTNDIMTVAERCGWG